MDPAIETIKTNGCDIDLYYDPDPMNPRTDWDPVCTIYYYKGSGRYILGDEAVSREDFEPLRKELEDEPGSYTYPLYAYIHGGIALSTSDFADPWDSGLAGFIHVTKERAENLLGLDLTDEIVYKAVQSELETWQAYLNGECYGYVISCAGIDLGSCWGYYDSKHAITDAMQEAEVVSPKEPVRQVTVRIGDDTFHWENLGDDALRVVHNHKIIGECDTLAAAWDLITKTSSE